MTFSFSQRSMGWVHALLCLLSAFLLFQVQPMISKFILPWFGGTPGVWTTCMLFFQAVLFAGYAYAHGLTRLPGRWQAAVHGLLLLGALAWLPVAPDAAWKPLGEEDPALRILMLLLLSVGLPYFMLSSTAPLVQVWFSRGTGNASPWRLYALSNAGSLTALLSYPVFFETRWDVLGQARLWSGAFVLFVLLSWVCLWRNRQVQDAGEKSVEAGDEQSPGWRRRLQWLLLPALASALLLAATNHVCQDVAVIPFLWVVPLALYLVSFIICFEHERWYCRRPALWALPVLPLAFLTCVESRLPTNEGWKALGRQVHAWVPAIPEKMDLAPNYLWQLGWALGALFFICMLCHGELTRLRPGTRRLTEFYLFISAGGALGGLFVSLGAPRLFTTFAEWPGTLMVACMLAFLVLARDASRFRLVLLLPLVVAGLWCMSAIGFQKERRLQRVRNFYGTLAVEEDWDSGLKMKFRRFMHGSIIHGMQNMGAPLRWVPICYFGHHTGAGKALDSVRYANARVGVVGMGAGIVACYAHLGHAFRFYEINPDVVRIAREQFTYLEDAEERGAEVEIVVADGRLAMEREGPQNFDVLLLDAFSGDSVPAHLLTIEAFRIYQRHLKPDGIIAVNITNSYLRLAPVLEKIAPEIGLRTIRISTEEKGDHFASEYILLTRNEAFLRANPSMPPKDKYLEAEKAMHPPVWTDRRHNLFEVLSLK
ncbi:MAG TPA: fused MFS/spermidine synthase [Prosthecobacter sp.]